MSKDYDIVGSYNNQQISALDCERTVNLYEYVDPKAKKPKALLPTAGLTRQPISFGTETQGCRGQFVFKGNQYAVYGKGVFLINAGMTSTLIGSLTTNTGYVGIEANEFQVIFVDGFKGYIWDTNAMTFAEITDTNFPAKPRDVTFLDGFFIVIQGDTNVFRLSRFNQGMVWGGGSTTFTADPATDLLTVSSTANYATGVPITVTGSALPAPLTSAGTYYCIRKDATHLQLATSYENAIHNPPIFIDITTAGTPPHTIITSGQLQQGAITAHPGTLVACRTLHRRLFLFSQNFTEVWENQGIGFNLPLRRNNSLLIEYGLAALGSLTVGFDRMFFIANDEDGLGPVVQVLGTDPIPVSTPALDAQLSIYATRQQISDATSFIIKENELVFYRLNFTAANHTFVFNVSMSTMQDKKWHEEEVLNGSRHPAQTHAYFNGVNYVGHYALPIMYRVESNNMTNDGEAIRRMRIPRPFVPEGYQRVRCDRFHLDLLQGNVEEEIVEESLVRRITETGVTRITEDGRIRITEQNAITVGDIQPVVFLALSQDGGQSYGYNLRGLMGDIGQRSYRTVWRKLQPTKRGQPFQPRFEFFNKVPFVILGAAWSFEILPQ